MSSTRRVLVAGRPGAYTVAGDGPPVVFLHGWGLGSRSYARALSELERLGWSVWAPALPGFGGTAELPEAEFSLGGYARWVVAFLDAVGLVEPVAVMGHSFGGGVAITTACAAPERVARLVLINSIGGSAWVRHGSAVRSMTERPLWDWGLHLPADVMPLRQLRRVVPVIVGEALPNALRNPRVFLRTAGLARKADLTAELQSLKEHRMPIVVLWGDSDRIITRESFESLCAAVGRAECVTVAGSHSWLVAEPGAFGEVMTNVVGVADRFDAHASPDAPL